MYEPHTHRTSQVIRDRPGALVTWAARSG